MTVRHARRVDPTTGSDRTTSPAAPRAARAASRRVVLAGAAGWLLSACEPRNLSHGTPSGRPGATASTAAAPADLVPHVDLPGLPAPVAPTPGVCPQLSGRQVAGQPQHYLACAGTAIALTVDDGPDPQWTPRMLALLDRYRVKATFSVIGRQAAAHPDLVREVAQAGHVVANHTYTHPDLQRLSPAAVEREVVRASDAIEKATGTRPTLFRAPGGAWSREVLARCAHEGLRPLGWSVDPRDWSRPGTRHIAETILTQTRPGSIILEHDGGGDRRQTLEALSVVLPKLLDAGYRFGSP